MKIMGSFGQKTTQTKSEIRFSDQLSINYGVSQLTTKSDQGA